MALIQTLLGALIGGAAVLLAEYFRDRRERDQERDARTERLRRDAEEFQRATLLEIQIHVNRLGRYTGEAIDARRQGSPPAERIADLDSRLRASQLHLLTLETRVNDEQVRKGCALIRRMCGQFDDQPAMVRAETFQREFRDANATLQGRIGTLRRERHTPPSPA